MGHWELFIGCIKKTLSIKKTRLAKGCHFFKQSFKMKTLINLKTLWTFIEKACELVKLYFLRFGKGVLKRNDVEDLKSVYRKIRKLMRSWRKCGREEVWRRKESKAFSASRPSSRHGGK